jgi:hypothetical protein
VQLDIGLLFGEQMKLNSIFALLALLTFAGCAAEVQRERATSTFEAVRDSSPPLTITRETTVDLVSGFRPTIKAGSKWQRAGRLGGRDAYRPLGDVFFLEGRDVHEAYLLLEGGTLVGFYLPGEHSVSMLKDKVVLPTN